MAGLPERLRGALAAARKARDRDRTLLLSTVLADLRNRELSLLHPLTEPEAEETLRGAIKRRRESVDQYGAAGRRDLADREAREIAMLEEFLPPPLAAGEIRAVVREAIAAGATQVGAVMARVMPTLKGRAEGKLVSDIAREELGRGG